MILELLAKRLIAAGLGVAGETVFIRHMPAETDQGILLKTPIVGVGIDHYLPGYHRPLIQAIVRAQNYAAGDQLAAQVQANLTIRGNTDFFDDGGTRRMVVKQMLPRSLPIDYPRSDGNGIELSVNFDAWLVLL